MELYGLFNRFLFRDEKNGKSIFLISLQDIDGSRKNIAVSGMVPEFIEKTPLLVSGEIVETEDYGKQIKAESFSLIAQNMFDAIEFVEKIIDKKKSHVIAREFIKITGTDIFKKYDLSLYEKSEYYKDFKSIISYIEGLMLLIRWMAVYNTPIYFFENIIKKYGTEKAEELFNKKIYQIGIKEGLSLEECDEIAKKNGKTAYDDERIKAAHRVVFLYFESKGHTYVILDEFYRALKRRIINHIFKDEIPCSFLYYAKPFWIEIEKKEEHYILYDKELLNAEKLIARNLIRLSKRTPEPYRDQYLVNMQNNNQIIYSDDQKNAIQMILKERGIGVLYGGPGVGKTTTIDALIQIYKMMHPDHTIKMCAPTGRAAQRMEESTNFPSSTIHKLLDIHPFNDDEIHKGKEDPIEADLIIMDETSMTDTRVFALFLNAVKAECGLIFVGDPDQLESVGPGRILFDLIHAKKGLFKVYELRQLFRQAENSVIIQNARKIKVGNSKLNTGKDFQIFYSNSKDETMKFIKTYANHFSSKELQFLCPIKKSDVGVKNTNKILQMIFNHSSKQRIQYGNRRFYLNDKVLLTKNCTEHEYYNGDIGYIQEITNKHIVIQCENRQITVPKEKLHDMDLAYTMTIHKSQGSEFDFVFIVIPELSKYFLTRNLLYTAITRAKRKVILLIENINEDDVLTYAIEKKPVERKTRLAELLEEQCETLFEN